MIKVHQPEKSSKLALRVREGKFPNSLHFLLQWANACDVNVVAKEVQFRNTKAALGDTDHDSVFV